MRGEHFRRGFWQGVTWPVSVPLCYAFYGLGHAISRVMNGPQAAVLYPVYSRLMLWSVYWNDIGGLSLWRFP